MMRRNCKGVSLLELMIVVAVLGILVSVAYPSYQSHVARGYRAEAHAQLSKLANLEEQYFIDHRSYTTDMTKLGMAADPYVTESGRYSIDAAITTSTFTLTATAQGTQASMDSSCTSITINTAGTKTPSGCW